MAYLYILPQINDYVKFLTSFVSTHLHIEDINFNHPDYILLHQDKIGIHDIKYLIRRLFIRPEKSKKLVVLGPLENMTLEAQNAFLKTLEEPPHYAIICLFAFSENKIIDTIKSRCQIINLKQEDKLFANYKNANSKIQSQKLNNEVFSQDLVNKFNQSNDITKQDVLNYLEFLNKKVLQVKGSVYKKAEILTKLADIHKALSVNSSLKNVWEMLTILQDIYNL